MTLRVTEVRRVNANVSRRIFTRTIVSPAAKDGDAQTVFKEQGLPCRAYNLRDPHPPSWVFGDFTYTFRVRDHNGLWSSATHMRFSRHGE